MQMRPSRVLDNLRAGKLVSCFKVNMDSVRLAEFAALKGYDCIWLDIEHTANDWSLIQNQIYAVKSQQADSMVRVRRGSYSEYTVPLELDASGLMVPHIMSLEDAREVVYRTRFHPLGRRALDGGNADGAYCNVGMDDYLQYANENRFIMLQIEDPEPMEELDAIAALPGYDILFFGPGDYSHAIGEAGDITHPKVVEARRRVAQAARKHGKFAGTPAPVSLMDEIISEGYQFLGMGGDVAAINTYANSSLTEFAQRNGQSATAQGGTEYYKK